MTVTDTDTDIHTSEKPSPSQPVHRTRRHVLRASLGLGAAGLVLAAGVGPGVLAQTAGRPPRGSASAQPADTSGLTPAQTEGPYFTRNSPERTSLVEPGMDGTVLTLTGQVRGPEGQPVPGALVDFWQADARGVYDNAGYTLRGRQSADENGAYTLTTVVPGLYTGRTRHIHVKVQATSGPLLTTQLYFAGEAQNARDGIFDPRLVVEESDNGDGTLGARFDFVVRTA